MKKHIFYSCILFTVSFLLFSCTTTTTDDNTNDTDGIVGTYRKENISWNGSFGYCEVNQIINISKTAPYQATIIGSYEVITEPSAGLGAPSIHYVGNYNLNGCTLTFSGGIITLVYTNDAVADGDLGQISDVAGTLSANNLIISVTRGQNNTTTGTFIKQ